MKRQIYNRPTNKQRDTSAHTQYRTIAVHNKQHKQPHTRNKTGLKRAVRMRNHTIHLRMPLKLLSRMDRRQTAITVTRRVSPKQNNWYHFPFPDFFNVISYEYIVQCDNYLIYSQTCTTTNTNHNPAIRTVNIVFSQFSSPIFANCPLQNTLLHPFIHQHFDHNDKHSNQRYFSTTT
jgi:hypothetical protein